MRYAIIGATGEQVRAAGGVDIKEATNTGIIFATLTGEQVDRLRAQGCQVTEVGKVQAPVIAPPVPVAAVPTYTPQQLVQLAGLEPLRGLTTPPLYGEGFNLAIIDSGIRETHRLVGGRVVYSKNYTSDPMRDGLDHGTGVCSIAVAIAPSCNILNLKVLDDKGTGTEEGVVLAIDDCISLQDTNPTIAPSVINLSLGAPDDGNPNNPLRVACRAAIQREIWIVASCGNGGPAERTITSPACEEYVIAVGSVKYLPDERAYIVSNFSSRGPTLEGLVKPDAVIFGEDIDMASSSSDTATVAKSGTSFATPLGSGLLLLYHEGVARLVYHEVPGAGIKPGVVKGVSVAEVLDKYLVRFCIKPTAAVKDNDYGFGMPWGSLLAQALGVRPAIDISSILTMATATAALGMLGMMVRMMVRAIK